MGTELHCPLCGEERARLRFQEGAHRVQDCLQCAVTYVSPRRDGESLIEEVYNSSYWRSERPRERGYSDYAGDGPLHARTYERRWRALGHLFPKAGRVLDVGCAEGTFLRLLADRGWEVQGIEPSAAMAERAARRIGEDRVRVTPLELTTIDGPRFDLITLWDVIEHLPSPIEALRRLRGWLAPGGRLLLETQDISSPMARVCGKRWQHFKHDEHLLHFTPETLARACQRAGLKVTHVQRRGAGKYVRGSFLVERSARLHPKLPRLLRPVLGGNWSVYVNPMDEIIAIAEAHA